MYEKDWVDVSIALLTPVVAIIGTTIAFIQVRINKNRLKHELFDRRYIIFDITRTFIKKITKEAKVSKTNIINFKNDTSTSEFLFNNEITSYIKMVHLKAVDLHYFQKEKDHESDSVILNWFDNEERNLASRFGESMMLFK